MSTSEEGAEPVTLPVLAESLDVDKVAVDQGGYRIAKHVRVHDERVDELLRHERVDIERRPAGRRLADRETVEPRWDGDTWVVPVLEEVLVVQKHLVLVEEVRIRRIGGTHRAPQDVSLRREEISIERLAPDPSRREPS